MNDYGFDYMNYITSIPNGMNYNQSEKTMLEIKFPNKYKTK